MKQINRYFKTDNKALYLSIFGEQTARRQIIMLSGFAEERKSIYRLEVELARSLCDACCIWRFDYSGCGESAGDFQDMSLATWQDDLKVLIKFQNFMYFFMEMQQKCCYVLGGKCCYVFRGFCCYVLGVHSTTSQHNSCQKTFF